MGDDFLWEGASGGELARVLGLPRVELREAVGSTLDLAHELAAAGAPAGTLVLAERQTAGRGRGGRRWTSEPGAGIWLTLVERPRDAEALGVLALRLGLRAAAVLDRFTDGAVRLKWPNDLYVGDGKLAGVLVEARWRDGAPDWAAIGVGLNVLVPPDQPRATSIAAGSSRLEVLGELVPALRAAAFARGGLSAAELDAFAVRDLARGRACVEPALGTVQGLSPEGELLVLTSGGVVACRAGSLVLPEER